MTPKKVQAKKIGTWPKFSLKTVPDFLLKFGAFCHKGMYTFFNSA
jgi:hypothetical protein